MTPRPQPAVARGRIATIMRRLSRAIHGLEEPAVEKIAEEQQEDPFQVLIATMLSAQTRDPVTAAASRRLFRVARTPRTMARLSTKEIEELIYPVSFCRNKAVHVKATCQQIIKRFGGRVPGTMKDLLTLPGVGRKTANLVLILAHSSGENICVDTHVHRISNRLGWVSTRTPEETEHALYAVVPKRWWPVVNLYLVTWGQNVCRPVYPLCGSCAIAGFCPRIGVTRVGREQGEKMTAPLQQRTAILAALAAAWLLQSVWLQGLQAPAAGPVVVLETVKGVIEFETYPEDAPKTVAQIVALVKKGFYNGQRFHRAERNFVIQIGDPQSRNMTYQDYWGRGGSGRPIGVAEITKKRTHIRGAVGMGHGGLAASADSQFYITLRPAPELDGKHTVFGRVIKGMEVAAKIEKADVLKKASVRE